MKCTSESGSAGVIESTPWVERFTRQSARGWTRVAIPRTQYSTPGRLLMSRRRGSGWTEVWEPGSRLPVTAEAASEVDAQRELDLPVRAQAHCARQCAVDFAE